MSRQRVKLHTIGERIKSLRKKYKHTVKEKEINGNIFIEYPKDGLTQQELADAMNVSLDTVKNWEQCYNYPSIDMLIKIANFLNCDVDYLLGRQELRYKIAISKDEYTGISDKAIENLTLAIKHNKSYIKILSLLLEDEFFLYQLSNYYTNPELLSESLCDFISKYKLQNGVDK